MSLLVDQSVPEGTCSQVLQSTSVDFVAFGEHQNFPCLKLIEIVILGLLHHPFWLQLVLRHFWGIIFQPFLNNSVWLRITDEGSVPEMRIWSILLIKSDLKWCIHLSRSLFLNTNRYSYYDVNTSLKSSLVRTGLSLMAKNTPAATNSNSSSFLPHYH